MKIFKTKLKAFSLVELILAIGIFSLISSMLVFLVVDATKTLENTKVRSRATNLIQEVSTVVTLLKDQSWQNIAINTDNGNKYLEFVDGSYHILDGTGTQGELTYYFNITNSMRDSLGNLVESGGATDPHTRLLTIYVEWVDSLGRAKSVSSPIYLNDWNTYSLINTTVADFNLGTHTNTYVENITDGEVSLETMLYSDWCNPSLSMNYYDLPGNGVPKSISTYNDTVIMGSGENMSGDPFIKVTATEDLSTNMPSVTDVLQLTTQYKTNDIFLLNDSYALLATDTNAEEVIILELNSSITQTGYFDIPTNTDADTIAGYGNRGFVTETNNLRSFDISSLNGSRPQIESVSLGGLANKTKATDIYVDDNYIYLTLRDHTNEFVIYQHTPTLQLVGQADIGNLNATALFISEDKTRAFIGTENSTTSDEFYILDISDKTGDYPILTSHDLGDMSVNALVSIDNRVMIGGQGGQEYQVINLDDISSPAVCGGLSLGVTINDMALVQTESSNYSYILSNDGQLKFIRGGLGGGGTDGNGYIDNGQFISEIFDTETDISRYYIMSLRSSVPDGTNLQLQLRASNTSDMSGSTWEGPDGTELTYYEGANIFNITSNLTGRYFQYKAVFTSDTVNTPLLEEFIINYEK